MQKLLEIHSKSLAAPANGDQWQTLNVFQQLVRQWETLHPYNSVHAIQVRGKVDLSRAQECWDETLADLGLGGVRVKNRKYQHFCLNGESAEYPITLLSQQSNLDQWLSSEMNHRFDAEEGVPFRPLLKVEGDHFWMGFTCQHWVADSVAIRMVLREWFFRLVEPSKARRKPLQIGAGPYWWLFGLHRSDGILNPVISFARWASLIRRARRIERDRFPDLHVNYLPYSLPYGGIDRLRAAARQAHSTVNSVLLAAVAEACYHYLPSRNGNNRRDLAVGTIVDLRPRADKDLSETLDIVLGFSSVLCREKDLPNWERLLNSVTRQIRASNTSWTAESSWMKMLGGIIAGKILSREMVYEFYRKRFSLAGGISNVNVNREWMKMYHPDPIMQYVRVSPTGPVSPVVMGATTLGHNMNIAMVYRPAIIGQPEAEKLGQSFIARLNQFAGCPV